MNDIINFIGQRIRNYRIQAGLTQEKLAELSELHPTYIGQIERGEKNATIESVQKISAALNISLSQLFDKLNYKPEEEVSIPLLCYNLILAKNKNEQEKIYNILLEIEKYKNG